MEILFFNRGEAQQNFDSDNLAQVKVQELPLFNVEKLAKATNNFHLSNKLGQGGFGPVYRVMDPSSCIWLNIYSNIFQPINFHLKTIKEALSFLT